MKHLSNLYWKISGVFFLIILILGGIYILLASNTALAYFEETNQRLNMSVAKQIAGEMPTFSDDHINKKPIEQHFKDVMALNPAAEIYLLDKKGKILAYSAPDSAVKRSSISLEPIDKFIATQGTVFIEGDNPRNPSTQKAFSAAAIDKGGTTSGYIYIILGGDKYQSVTKDSLAGYKLKIGLASIGFTIMAALLIGLVAFLLITRDLNKMINHVKEFQKGAWHKRLVLDSGGELGLLASTFNTMAGTIEANIRDIEAMEVSRRELVANISHDLRTPLAVIQGYSETLLLKNDKLSQTERTDYTRIVLKNANRLTKLVDELFEFSKLEAKAIVPAFEPFSIAELLLDNVLKYRMIADKKNISIHTNIPKEIGFVFADIGLIDRVLQNLIDNAI